MKQEATGTDMIRDLSVSWRNGVTERGGFGRILAAMLEVGA